MGVYELTGILLYVLLCVLTVLLLWRIRKQKVNKPRLNKAPARFLETPTEDEIASLKDAYKLDWRPERKVNSYLPDTVPELVGVSEGVSPLVTELIYKLNAPEVSAKDIGQLIASDQGLTSFVLQRANSPFYGLVQKVDNIFNAVVLLGSAEVSRIVIEESMNKSGIRPSRSEWFHAYITSIIAAYISNSIGMASNAGTLVTMAMMHDIGRNTLHKNISQQEKENIPEDPRARIRQEIDLFGIDHARLGAMLARKWNIPENVCKCIEVHHWPMFWPLRETAKDVPDITRELAILSVSDVTARHYTGAIEGPYIGEDYYLFIRKPPDPSRILVPELRRRLDRIRNMYAQRSIEDNQ